MFAPHPQAGLVAGTAIEFVTDMAIRPLFLKELRSLPPERGSVVDHYSGGTLGGSIMDDIRPEWPYTPVQTETYPTPSESLQQEAPTQEGQTQDGH